jgi:hypothetical protein
LNSIARVAQLVVGLHVGQAHRVAVRVGRDRRHFSDQAARLEAAGLDVVDVFGVGVERGERGDRSYENAHGVRVVAVTLHEALAVLMEHRVHLDVVRPCIEVLLVRKLALDDEVGRLEKAALLGELFDRVAAVAQDPLVAVDERDGAAAAGRIGEGGIVGHEPEVVGPGLDLAQIERADRTVLDRQIVALSGAVIGDSEGVFPHRVVSCVPSVPLARPAAKLSNRQARSIETGRLRSGNLGKKAGKCARAATTAARSLWRNAERGDRRHSGSRSVALRGLRCSRERARPKRALR